MAKPYKFRELVKVLRQHDPRFEFWKNRGKGSERIIYRRMCKDGRNPCR